MKTWDDVFAQKLSSGYDHVWAAYYADRYIERRRREMMRKPTQQESKVINDLIEVASRWPMTLQLFSQSGSLLVVDRNTGQVFSDLSGMIPNDGGDPGTETDEDGIDWLKR